MIKRTLEISKHPTYVSVRHKQLLLQQRDKNDKQSYPIEDLGFVYVDHPQVTYSHQALMSMLESGTSLIVCDKRHLPAGMLLPFSGHAENVSRLNIQLEVSIPRRKQLWKQIVQAKVLAQSRIVEDQKAKKHLHNLSSRVRSGDAQNIEAQAARLYWSVWLGKEQDFKRRPDGEDDINGLLNYGYAVIRAAVARALVSAGLQPAIGIHHHNRGNSFCLADDLMEPLRPLVDARVRELVRNDITQVCTTSKAALLSLLSVTVELNGTKGPLMVTLAKVTASLLRCFENRLEKLLLPIGVGEEMQLPPVPTNRH